MAGHLRLNTPLFVWSKVLVCGDLHSDVGVSVMHGGQLIVAGSIQAPAVISDGCLVVQRRVEARVVSFGSGLTKRAATRHGAFVGAQVGEGVQAEVLDSRFRLGCKVDAGAILRHAGSSSSDEAELKVRRTLASGLLRPDGLLDAKALVDYLRDRRSLSGGSNGSFSTASLDEVMRAWRNAQSN